VMSGLLTGILLGRVLAGAIGEHGGCERCSGSAAPWRG